MNSDTNITIDHDKNSVVNTAPYSFDNSIEKNKKAERWSTETNIPMMYDEFDLKKLEDSYNHYLTGTHDQKIHADDESIAIYGYNNRERYQMIKGILLRSDANNHFAKPKEPISVSSEIPATETEFMNKIQQEASAINDQLADKFMNDCNIHMIKDSDACNMNTLEDSYNKYMSTNYTNRKKSDLRSMEIYGKNNADRYKELKQMVSKIDAKTGSLEKEGLGVTSDIPVTESVSINPIIAKLDDEMKDIEYGYPDKNNKNMMHTDPDSFDNENRFIRLYKLLSPAQMKKCKCGVCFDQVEYEREYLEKHGVSVESYFMGYEKHYNDMPTHTFIVINDNGKYIWYEHSWYDYRGIHTYSTIEDLMSDIADKFMNNDTTNIDSLVCVPYTKPKYGLSYNDFIKHATAIRNVENTVVKEMTSIIESNVSNIDKASSLFKLLRFNSSNFVESCIIKRRYDDLINESKEDDSPRKLDTTPFFTPSELIDLGVFASDKNCYSSTPDNTMLDDGVTTRQWFDNYRYMCDGLVCEDYAAKWIHKMRCLYYDFDKIKETGDLKRINDRKQSILELGWNPELEFNGDIIVRATNRVNNILYERAGKYNHIDLTINEDDPIAGYIDKSIDDSIVPVFIILDKGNIPILSKAIAGFTKSDYTHASIGFNPDMSENYSFIAGGFRNENIESYGSDNITVYTFFVKNKVMKKLKKHLQEFIDNTSNTIYDITKYFDYLLDNTRKNTSQFAQVCSTFVDNMLRSAGINITTIGRGIVSPGDVHNAMVKYSGAIYKVYDGNAKKYKPAVVKSRITKLRKSDKTKVLKENGSIPASMVFDTFSKNKDIKYLIEHSYALNGYNKTIYEDFIEPVTSISIIETKMFPAQFDDNGNLIIYKAKSKNIDYAQELYDSNKLLQLYERNNNVEGMKYEVAKLWFLNSTIEKTLHTNKNKDLNRKMLIDSRSRILDIFYRYMDIIMKYDNDWNFVAYYNNTPFSDASVKINASTLKYTISTLKNIVRPT